MKLEIPENKEELRFLGMTTYLSKFIPNYSQTSAPLRTLLEKDCEWHWEEQQNVAFSPLKRYITNAPVLKFFNPKSETRVSVDASSKGIDAVLLQEGCPIAYAPKSLTATQQNYTQKKKC